METDELVQSWIERAEESGRENELRIYREIPVALEWTEKVMEAGGLIIPASGARSALCVFEGVRGSAGERLRCYQEAIASPERNLGLWFYLCFAIPGSWEVRRRYERRELIWEGGDGPLCRHTRLWMGGPSWFAWSPKCQHGPEADGIDDPHWVDRENLGKPAPEEGLVKLTELWHA